MDLVSKRVLLAGWGCENPSDTYMHQIWYLMLKRIFPDIKTFDSKKFYFQYGKDIMNQMLLENLEKEKFDLILFAMENDEFYPETLAKISEDNNAKMILIICDDDTRFDNWSRYLGLFFDGLIQSPLRKKDYEKEGIKNTFFHFDYNTYKLEPMSIEKEYDLTFIGRPKADRYEIMKYLKENGIKVGLFGWGWNEYSDLKDVYKGPLSQEDYAKVINQSKISLNFTKAGFSEETKKPKKEGAHYNMKGRFFEVALCKGFQLIEDYPGLENFFRDGEEIGTFRTNEELIEKIKYYLEHEKEREKLAENAYKKTITKYNREKDLERIFTTIFKIKEKRSILQKSNKKILVLNKEDLFSSNLKEKLLTIDYVSFKSENLKKASKLKDFFLARALDKTGKNVACCDYYVNSFNLGDYMLFLSKFAFIRIGKEANKLLDVNQLMIKKDFFLENLETFKNLFNNQKTEFLNEENTAFVSIPLISINKTQNLEYEKMIKAFEMRFPNKLLSLIYQKKLFTSTYPYKLAIKSLFGSPFILKYLKELKKSKNSREKLSVNKVYLEGSPLEKFMKS
jgi:hypothetical protein